MTFKRGWEKMRYVVLGWRCAMRVCAQSEGSGEGVEKLSAGGWEGWAYKLRE